ncbi:potassium transporter Kup [bacterium]|nr:potassium transporter Kup [bacterium]
MSEEVAPGAVEIPPPLATEPDEPEPADTGGVHGSYAALTLGALGVVFGDIGTSPLYTVQECFGEHGVTAGLRDNVLGILSLFFWSLTLVVTLKYVTVLMRADNKGEGGIMALLSLVPAEQRRIIGTSVGWVTVLVLIGASLLFGDGVITPAISVLSAIEGLKLIDPNLANYVVPITVGILIALFGIQSHGTGGLGKLFGPIMVCWFVTIGALGMIHLWENPSILVAVSPVHAASFFYHNGYHGFVLLGSVVLCVTGGEALYADMGHFGKGPIRLAWGALVFPALLLNYFGQGALILQNSGAASAPFFSMVSHPGARIALVILATAATVIASQGLISAVFSLTHQAMRLGYFPRVMVTHTSQEMEGQIYVPAVNWALGLACLTLVLIFRESARLAAAFGLAVSGTMGLTSVILHSVTRNTWKWPAWKSHGLLILFLSFDIPFFAATCTKFVDGGYIPFVIGAFVFVCMWTWSIGRCLLREHYQAHEVNCEQLRRMLKEQPPVRTPGLSIYLASNRDVAPPVLLIQLQRFRGLSEEILFLTITSESVPYVPEAERLEVQILDEGYYRVVAHYGFMELPNIPSIVKRAARRLPLRHQLSNATYFIGRETFAATNSGRMRAWQERLFAFMARNSADITMVFDLPSDQVVEVGSRLEL